MAGGPLLEAWEKFLPLVKDKRLRFLIVMVGNVLALLFVYTALKIFVPDFPIDLFS